VLNLSDNYPPGKCWVNLKFTHHFAYILPSGFFISLSLVSQFTLVFTAYLAKKPAGKYAGKVMGMF
jgi:hypothetical protein